MIHPLGPLHRFHLKLSPSATRSQASGERPGERASESLILPFGYSPTHNPNAAAPSLLRHHKASIVHAGADSTGLGATPEAGVTYQCLMQMGQTATIALASAATLVARSISLKTGATTATPPTFRALLSVNSPIAGSGFRSGTALRAA